MVENKEIAKIVGRDVTHVTGFFSIHADGSFLNGAGLGSGEDRNVTVVKSYWRDRKVPYVSSQAWRRWLRNTMIQKTGWPASILEAVMRNEKGNTSKIATKLDPIQYPEDDLFGYMYASGKSKKDTTLRDDLPDEQLIRTSPFRSSILRGVPELTRMAHDEGYVHLPDDSPIPYKTEFYSGELVALFGLDLYRLGIFEKKGKISQELDPKKLEKHKDKVDIIDHPIFGSRGSIVKVKDLISHQNKRAEGLLQALSVLDGGAKMTQFGTDLTPKLLILVGMSSGNLIFDDLLGEEEGKPSLKIPLFKELLKDYSSKIKTSVYIGLRSGYLGNEEEVKVIKVDGIDIVISTPIKIVEKFCEELK